LTFDQKREKALSIRQRTSELASLQGIQCPEFAFGGSMSAAPLFVCIYKYTLLRYNVAAFLQTGSLETAALDILSTGMSDVPGTGIFI